MVSSKKDDGLAAPISDRKCAKCNKLLEGNYIALSKREASAEKEYFCKPCSVALCKVCETEIEPGEIRVYFKENPYHRKCLVCSKCKAELRDQLYTDEDGKFKCNTCQEEGADKCGKCKEVVLSGVKVDGKSFHKNCFLCEACNKELAGSYFKNPTTGAFECRPCYAKNSCPKCKACDQPVVDIGFRIFEDDNYHDACFTCRICQNKIEETRLVNVGDESKKPAHKACAEGKTKGAAGGAGKNKKKKKKGSKGQ